MVDPRNKGRVFPEFTYLVERGKLREFLLAIGEKNPAYGLDDPPLPPTFATVFAFWGGGGMERLLEELGIEMRNVLHGEQEYEYLSPIHVGDTVKGTPHIEDIYTRAGMEFVELMFEYVNQHNVPVLKDRTLVIVRGKHSEHIL